jgi:antitoxin component of MazEF toxin-antitoxin module
LDRGHILLTTVIAVYTVILQGGLQMEAVKIRKQGNSLSVTLDQATLRAANLREGDHVALAVRNGVVTLVPVEIRPRLLEVGRKVISRNRRALDRLAK